MVVNSSVVREISIRIGIWRDNVSSFRNAGSVTMGQEMMGDVEPVRGLYFIERYDL
jgi:hypothetical protein